MVLIEQIKAKNRRFRVRVFKVWIGEKSRIYPYPGESAHLLQGDRYSQLLSGTRGWDRIFLNSS